MTPDERARIAQDVLARSRADATEVTVTEARIALTRFTHESVSQNVDESDATVRVRALVDGRSGVAATNAFDAASLADVVERARELAAFAPRESIPPELAGASTVVAPAGAYAAATAEATPQQRAAIADAIFAHARRGELWSSGYVSTASTGLTIATSAGALHAFDGTNAAANVKMSGSDATGFAESYANDVAALDGSALGARAAAKAEASREPVAVETGDWTVILEPAAAGELLHFLVAHFSAETYAEGSSFISGKLGERVVGDNVSLYDDVRDPLNPAMPFDYEGVPTQRVALLDAGVAAGIVTDSAWAKRLARENTGHALPAPNAYGPQARSAVLAAGSASTDELIATTKRGLLITRLWYVRIVDQRTVLLTGMTRDGTFLIEDGIVTRGVRNMRFNESLVRAFATCEIANVPARTGGYSYALVTPAIKFHHFRFASASPY